MSDRTAGIILIGWGVVVVVTVVVLYRAAKAADKRMEAEEIERDFQASETEAEQRERFARDAAIPLDNAAWQERARRAESLGFFGDDDPQLPRSA